MPAPGVASRVVWWWAAAALPIVAAASCSDPVAPTGDDLPPALIVPRDTGTAQRSVAAENHLAGDAGWLLIMVVWGSFTRGCWGGCEGKVRPV
jgi:hypothetical protein